MPNRMYPSAIIPIEARATLAPALSGDHIPAAAGMRNAAATTASQNRNTLMPALRPASPANVFPAGAISDDGAGHHAGGNQGTP